MENSQNRSCSSLSSALKIVGTSPVVLMVLSLTYFTQNVRREHYAYGIIAAGTLLGLSLYIVSRISRDSETRPKSLGDISGNISRFLARAVDVILMVSKYMVLLIIIDIFANILFTYFPFVDEVRKSLAIYRILFGLGLALIGLTLYISLIRYQSVFLVLSVAATLVFSLTLVVQYFLGVNLALPKPLYSPGSPLPSFFWATTLAFYSMEFVSGSIKIMSESTNSRSSSCYIAITSALVVSAIYITILLSGGWIRSSPSAPGTLDLIFLESSKLNHYLKTSTIDRYAITSTVLCVCLPVLCIVLFVTQFDIFIEAFKNLVNTGSENKLWTLSLLILGVLFTQTLFNDIAGGFHFYLMVVVIGITPVLADHPFLCYLLSSKKITLLTAVCILATLFICAVLVGTIRTLGDVLQEN